MSKKSSLIVNLPNLTPQVTLPYHLGKLLILIIAAKEGGISSLALHDAGCVTPANGVSALKALGAKIHSDRKHAIDAKGEERPGVAHYTYMGWQ